MKIQVGCDGRMYVVRRSTKTHKRSKLQLGRYKKNEITRDWWLVKAKQCEGYSGSIQLSQIDFPKQFIGKKVRFIVEVIDYDKRLSEDGL